ncbi:MAG: alpha/beta fold hydrolase, partial [Deltaproteobacteria bacterium]|nr:alpha/beta fold hydrolase [Deltaproteobacteria bacterium]
MIRASAKQLASFDGTRLGYRVYGSRGPWLVLVNGLGSSYDCWELLLDSLAERWRVLIWDLRGLYGSAIPVNRRRLTMADHCRDLEALLAAERVSCAVVGGWSMGVQIALEAYRRLPEQVVGLVLINGTYGRFFSSCFHLPLPWLLLPPVLRLGHAGSPFVSRLVSG